MSTNLQYSTHILVLREMEWSRGEMVEEKG